MKAAKLEGLELTWSVRVEAVEDSQSGARKTSFEILWSWIQICHFSGRMPSSVSWGVGIMEDYFGGVNGGLGGIVPREHLCLAFVT